MAEPGGEACRRAVRTFLGEIRKPGPLLVAISGGSDSTALLLLLKQALDAGAGPGMRLAAATVDHGLRAASADEAARVAAWCRDLGVPHETLPWTGEKPKTGLQNAARKARYRLLHEAAERMGAVAVATGHTLDDQLETVTMRRRRSGEDGDANGLAGMAPATLHGGSCWILRPLLKLRRHDLRAFLTGEGVGWIDDPSNVDPAFERVRVRSAGPEAAQMEIDRAAARRRDRMALAGELIGRGAACHEGALFSLPVDGGDRQVLLDATLSLAALAGGMAHRAGRAQAEAAGRFLAGEDGRLSLARCVLEKRGGRLFIHRERRNLPILEITAGGTAIWDGRFRIENRGSDVLVVGPAEGMRGEAETDGAPGAPSVALRTARSGQPRVTLPAGRPAPGEAFAQSHYLALYDTFLPAFDLKLANALARLVGRRDYGAPPVHLL